MTRWCLVVEDESPLGELICDNLQLEGYGTELVQDGERALERLAKGGIDLLILDIMLPGKDGFAVLRELRQRDPHLPVLILSARAADQDRVRGLELQADDYLTKPFNLRELLLRVAALLRRQPAARADDATLAFGGNEVDFKAHRATTFRGESADLTPAEIKLLRLLWSREGEVVSRSDIVHHVFGPATPQSHRTVDNLVLNLRRLFEHDSKQPRHLHTVRGVGLRFVRGADADGAADDGGSAEAATGDAATGDAGSGDGGVGESRRGTSDGEGTS